AEIYYSFGLISPMLNVAFVALLQYNTNAVTDGGELSLCSLIPAMATQPPHQKDLPVPETVMQQSMLQQAQAAAAAQTDSAGARHTTQETLLQKTDLITPDPAEDYIPPPAYGDIYGEIRNEKDGLGTSA